MFFIAAFASSSVWVCLKYYCNLQFVSTKNCHSTKSAHTSRVQLHSLARCLRSADIAREQCNWRKTTIHWMTWRAGARARAPLQFLHYYCSCVVFSDSLLFLFRCWSRRANGSTIHLCQIGAKINKRIGVTWLWGRFCVPHYFSFIYSRGICFQLF